MLLWLLLVTLAAGRQITDDESCQFVALRYLYVESRCVASVCTNMVFLGDRFQRASMRGSPVGCQTARLAMDEFYNEFENVEHNAKRQRLSAVDAIVDVLDVYVMDNLRQLHNWRGSESDPGILESLRIAELAIAHIAFASGDEWTSSTVPAVKETIQYKRFTDLIDRLAWTLVRRSLLAIDTASVAMMHFVFDVSSLLGGHSLEAFSDASASAVQRPLAYRPARRWDRVRGPSPNVLMASATVERIRARSVSGADMVLFNSLLANWDTSSASTEQALISEQIRGDLCPDLVNVLRSIAPSRALQVIIVRMGVTLIDMCRGHARTSVLRDTVSFWAEPFTQRLASSPLTLSSPPPPLSNRASRPVCRGMRSRRCSAPC